MFNFFSCCQGLPRQDWGFGERMNICISTCSIFTSELMESVKVMLRKSCAFQSANGLFNYSCGEVESVPVANGHFFIKARDKLFFFSQSTEFFFIKALVK